MKVVVLLLSLFVASMGFLSIFAPRWAGALARAFAGRGGLYVATAIRFVLGAGLLLLADASRAPMFLRVLGVIIVVVAIVIPLLGLDRHRRMIDWWLSAGRTVQLMWGAFALAVGVFLIYATA